MPRPRKTYARTVVIPVPSGTKDRVREWAASEDRNVTQWVTRALRAALDDPRSEARRLAGEPLPREWPEKLYLELPGEVVDAAQLVAGRYTCTCEFVSRAVMSALAAVPA